MRLKYAVIQPGELPGNTHMGRVVSRHSMLHKALEARHWSQQVRELNVAVRPGEIIRFDHLTRWD